MRSEYVSPATLASFDGEQPPVPPAPAPEPGSEKRLTQTEVNRIMADEKRKYQVQLQRVEKMLEEVSASKNLTVQEREQLTAQRDELQATLRTKEEQAAHEKKQLEESFKKQLADKTKDAETWQKRYEATTIDSALQDAAVGGDAFSTQQVVNLLRPSTRLAEVRDDKGRFTGEHQVVVSFPDSAEDGTAITRELSPHDAVKAMQAKPNAYGNLFKSGVVSGIGSGSGGGTPSSNGKIDVRKLTQQQYMEIREKTPELLGLRPKKGRA
jgi:hypothetical protein